MSDFTSLAYLNAPSYTARKAIAAGHAAMRVGQVGVARPVACGQR
jgi:hypothetical protein